MVDLRQIGDTEGVRTAVDLDVLRIGDFRRVFTAAVVSLVGDGIVPVALTFAVLDLTGSATDLGLVLATGTVTLLGALLFGGVVADRVSRRTVMIGADVVRLIGQATIGALLVTGHAGVPAIAASQGFSAPPPGSSTRPRAGSCRRSPASTSSRPTRYAGSRWQPAASAARRSAACSSSPSAPGRRS